MKFRKILKNRKAITPVMIGIIVAASVLTVFFIVMAATVPLMRKEIEMEIFAETIKGNDTWSKSLKFLIVSDYDEGYLDKVEIYKSGETHLWADKNINLKFNKSETKHLGIAAFDATSYAIAAAEINGTDLEFIHTQNYTIRIYFSNMDGIQQPFREYAFEYEKLD